VERDIKILLLKRRYLETWLSWKVRGVYHEVNPALRIDTNSSLLRAIQTIPKPENIDLVLFHEGVALSDAVGRGYQLQDMVDDMLQFYVNDIQSLDLLNERQGLVIDYSEIAPRFDEIAGVLG